MTTNINEQLVNDDQIILHIEVEDELAHFALRVYVERELHDTNL
jgi:hypothetical protein